MHFFISGGKQFFCIGKVIKVCGLVDSWYEDVKDPALMVATLKNEKHGAHIFTFFQRPPHVQPLYNYYMEPYPVSIIKNTSYDEWWNKSIGKKTRQAVSMAQKKGVKVRITEFNDEFVKGIHSIYNETPVRSGRSFPHYNDTLEKVRAENSTFLDRSVFLGAYYENELIGFTKIVFEDEFADILQHLSKMLHRDKNATNALMAKAVELCAARGAGYIAYGDWNDTNLSGYKRHNGFSRMDLPKYFIPLTWIGSVALRLKLHRPINQLLPAKTLPYLRELRRKWHEMQAHINTKFS